MFRMMLDRFSELALDDEDNLRDNRRPDQRPPDWPWTIWMLLAGRGFGKTYAGAHFVNECEQRGIRQFALISGTSADVRDVMVMNPRSGIIALAPLGRKPRYEPSKRRILWPSGATGMIFSAEEPERLRGPEHEVIWGDEIDAWGEKTNPQKAFDTFTNMMFGLRIGPRPMAMLTSTPKPGRLVAKMLKRAKERNDVAVTRGSTHDNRDNLSESFYSEVIKVYEGTRTYRQEVEGELLEDVEGALWSQHTLDENRIQEFPEDLSRVVVAIDPAVTSKKDSDETGIIVCGVDREGVAYVLKDASVRGTPLVWVNTAVSCYEAFGADCIVGETNMGGDVIEEIVRAHHPKVPFKQVKATRGKALRAEPIALLYEKGMVKHYKVFDQLEDQMCAMTVTGYADVGSPDRVDALVYALAELVRPFGANVEMLGRADW